MSNYKNKYLQVTLFAVFFFILIVVLNNVLAIGQRFGDVHYSLEWIFYMGSFGLFAYLVLVPILLVMKLPHTRISDFMSDNPQIDEKKLKKTVNQMMTSKYLSNEEKNQIEESFKEGMAEDAIKSVYINKASLIEKEVEDTASLVLLTTAISQNGMLDGISILFYNFRMVKRIVGIAGFRPSIRQLSTMVRDIFITAFIFNTIEEINPEEMLEDILDASGEKLFGKIISKISGSFIQGCFSAYVTLKIGYVTKYWLYMSEDDFKEKNIKKQSRTEARKILVTKVIKNTVGVMPKQAAQYAGKIFNRNVNRKENVEL